MIPENWVQTTLEEVAKWGSGGTPSRRKPEYFQGEIPWIKTGELGAMYIFDAKEKITEEAVAQSSAKIFPKGSVGIAMYGATIGKLSIWGIDASTNQACAVGLSTPFLLDNKFLYYYLASQKRKLIKEGKGGAQPNISQGLLKSWPISLPPFNEQKRIVAKIEELFTKLDAGVASLQVAQAQLKTYRQALLKHAFEGKLTAQWRADNADKLEDAQTLLQRIQTKRQARHQAELAAWEANGKQGQKPRPLKELPPLTPAELADLPELPAGWAWASMSEVWLESILGKMLDKQKNRGEFKPYLRNINVRWGSFDIDNLLEMRFQADEHERYGLKEGDLVICEGGEPGRCAVWKSKSHQGMKIQKALHRVRFPETVNPFFVQKYFELCASSKRLENFFTGTTIKHLTGQGLAKLPVTICSLAEQNEIIAQLEARLSVVDQVEQTITNALHQSEALHQSILKKAFAGQLVPQDPQDEPASVLLARIRAAKTNNR